MNKTRLLLFAAATLGSACAQKVGAPTGDLTSIGVDELFSVEVSSVGRKAQKLSKAPAAVFVLTSEDIRRSGATSIPEALQWVPGLTVLRIDGRSWAVSARGGARQYSDKILVMIDGRSLYTPLFSGTIWDTIDVSLEDVEQIEIVRGPGAVMWGPNAVNGVINIITKRAQSTKGAMVSAAAGNEQRGAAEARWGAAPSDHLAYRIWGKLDDSNPAYGSPGYYKFSDRFIYRDPSIKNLDTDNGRLGFRFDGQSGEENQWMAQGDFYKANRQDALGYPVLLPNVIDRVQGHSDYEGGFVQAKWTQTTSAGNEGVLQFAYSKDQINYPFLGLDLNNLTVDYQKRRQTGESNEIYWGAGYQQYWDDTESNRFVGFDPKASTYRVGDVVIRDEWQIVPTRLMVSAGIRIDYNSYRHFEYQPSLRLLFTPSSRQSAWFALSRAVRVPTRFDRDVEIDEGAQLVPGVPLPISTSVKGSIATRSETERSAELGYKFQAGQRWSFDGSLFWSYYSRLRALEGPALPNLVFAGQVPSLQVPLTMDNPGAGRTYGAEVWSIWQVRAGWRLIPSYSYLNETLWLPGSAYNVYYWDGSPTSPRHQALLRSQFDLGRAWQLDLMAKARSRDPIYGTAGGLLVDARIGWRPWRSGELSFSAKDLTNRPVVESYGELLLPAIPLRRTFEIKFTQRF
jgi:iron complex outermembrane receptor protein